MLGVAVPQHPAARLCPSAAAARRRQELRAASAEARARDASARAAANDRLRRASVDDSPTERAARGKPHKQSARCLWCLWVCSEQVACVHSPRIAQSARATPARRCAGHRVGGRRAVSSHPPVLLVITLS